MRYVKLFVLQVSSVVGLFLGHYIAPDRPLYPFMPSKNESELIKYIELNIYLVEGFIVAAITYFVSKLLKQSLLSSLIIILTTGILLSQLDSIRAGELMFQFYFFPTLAYLCGTLAFFGLVKVCNDLYSTN